jgi:hypothetical protein
MDRVRFVDGLVTRLRYALQQQERAATSRAMERAAERGIAQSFAASQADIHEANLVAGITEVADFTFDAIASVGLGPGTARPRSIVAIPDDDDMGCCDSLGDPDE